MTINIGIICGREIVVAADTMFCDTQIGSVSYASKMSVVEFHPCDHVLVAQAGLPAITNRIVEIAKEKAIGKFIKSTLTVTEIFESAVRQLKNECHADQWEHGKYYGAQLLIAFFVNRKPFLFKLDVYGLGVAQDSMNHFATAGIGGALAEYLLTEFTEPRGDSSKAIAAAIYAIKKVKTFQCATCGGNTEIRAMATMSISNLDHPTIGRAINISQTFVNESEKNIANMESGLRRSFKGGMLRILNDVASGIASKKIELHEKDR